ncbi:hypothetical protein DOK76_03835 [Vagococcus sp. DIV0080]|uniref:Uncharacterized protein n=1 Tax=Candidatus Vagococcus giribetii TaxID=2230876 RepID=A0ABS3HRD3_9ENTE|nr:hypothetical protein [Vagococcus sp. DIV0080]MBO0476186.1 hypothetical protein [Vagococcus sp. DIV0080]
MRRIKRLAKKFFWPWIFLGIFCTLASTMLNYFFPGSFIDIFIDKAMSYVFAPVITGIIIIGLGFMDEYDRKLKE